MIHKTIWNNIISSLHNNPQEFKTYPKTNKIPLWFRAYSDGQTIYVESAQQNNPTSNISERRILDESIFEKIYPIYIRREKGEKISKEAVSTTINSVYYYSLIKHFSSNKKIICRICWNDVDWEYPTKKPNNIETADSFVSVNGYGQEEWLFRLDWLIDGKHYAFLQPVGKGYNNLQGTTCDIILYTYNAKYREHWIGGIDNVYIPLLGEIDKAYDIYRKNGWLDIMKNECKSINASFVEDKNDHSSVFNICFSPIDLWLNNPVIKGKSYLNSYYYQPMSWESLLNRNSAACNISKTTSLKTTSSKRKGTEDKEVSLLHNMIQQELYDVIFPEMYGNKAVIKINDNGVDVKLAIKNNLIYVEIKKAKSAREAIRQSIGQLLEYIHYPNKNNEFPNKMVIIGIHKPENEDTNYLKVLEKTYKLNFHYCYIKTNEMKLYDWSL